MNQHSLNYGETPSIQRITGNMSFVNRYVSNRTLEKNASIKSIVLPPIEQNSLKNIESSMFRINTEVRNKQRVKELLGWARSDYGVKLVQNMHAQRMMIRDPLRKEVNFIFKVKKQHIEMKNNEAALTIQTLLFRGLFTRIKYVNMRDYVVGCIIKVQSFYKMI